MWLLVTALAAVVSTALWHRSACGDKYKLGFLSLIYWGATLMWLVDQVMAVAQGGGQFLEIDANATGLALSVLVLGLFIWLVRLVAGDPKRVLRSIVSRRQSSAG